MLVRACAAHRTSLVLTGVLAACAWGEVGLPPAEEQITVQASLDAGSTRQVIYIERALLPEERVSSFQRQARPLAVPPSRVEVREVGGPLYSFQMDPGDSSRFVADLTPVPLGRYELLIEAEGRTIRATTVVPGPVVIVDPAADTVDRPATELQLRWRSGSAANYAWATSAGDTSTFLYFDPTWVGSDTAAAVCVCDISSWRASVVWVLAFDETSARVYQAWRDGRGFAGNVDGAIGVFGAMTWDRFFVRVPP